MFSGTNDELNEDIGPADDLFSEETVLQEQDSIKVKIEDVIGSVGALQDDPFNDYPFEDNLSRNDPFEDNLSREESIHEDVVPQTTQDEYIQQSLKKLRAATTKTRQASAPTRFEQETKPIVDGFGFVSRVGPKIRSTICRKTIYKGTCAIQYHDPNHGTGRTSRYHATIACLGQMTLDKKFQFAKKTWTESIPLKLATDIAKNISKGMDKIVHLKKK